VRIEKENKKDQAVRGGEALSNLTYAMNT